MASGAGETSRRHTSPTSPCSPSCSRARSSSTSFGTDERWRRPSRRSAGDLRHPSPPRRCGRLEALAPRPERVLRGVGEFLHEPFAQDMLEYHRTGQQRVWSGHPQDPEYVDHGHVSLPPTAGLRNWRTELSAAEQRALEAAAQPLLGELGYAADRPALRAFLRVEADSLRRLPGTLKRKTLSRARGLRFELAAQYGQARSRR